MLITLEGIEGSGKTTQMDAASRFVRAQGYECISTREPGGTPLGTRIRGLLLDPANADIDATAELLLYAADRVQHVQRIIRPALAAGRVVLCDRFIDATVAYQGYARGLGLETIAALHRLVLGGLKPDLTLLIDVPAEVGLARAWTAVKEGGRSRSETRFEQEALDFHRRVRDGYLALAAAEPDRFCVIDGRQGPDAVGRDILAALARRLSSVPPDGANDG